MGSSWVLGSESVSSSMSSSISIHSGVRCPEADCVRRSTCRAKALEGALDLWAEGEGEGVAEGCLSCIWLGGGLAGVWVGTCVHGRLFTSSPFHGASVLRTFGSSEVHRAPHSRFFRPSRGRGRGVFFGHNMCRIDRRSVRRWWWERKKCVEPIHVTLIRTRSSCEVQSKTGKIIEGHHISLRYLM